MLFVLVIALVMILLFISGCASVRPGAESETLEEPVEEKEAPVAEGVVEEAEPAFEDEIVEEEALVLTCEEWAASLFPVQWVFNQDVTQDPALTKEVLGLRQGEWKDGSTIKGTSYTSIKKGSETGENINYYYTKPIFIALPYEKHGFSFSEKVIDDKGTVLGENYFMIRPVFRVIHDAVEEEADRQGNPIKVRYLSLVVVEPNFVSCEKVD